MELVKYMSRIIGDNFDQNIKYKLYRSVYEIIHPTISKSNISSYKIIVSEEILPLRVFYPTKISDLDSVIIFVAGDGEVSGCRNKYSDICREISLKCNQLVIALDYFNIENKFPNVLNRCYDSIKYLIEVLNENGIVRGKITVMGDSTGANLVSAMMEMMQEKKEKLFDKSIILYPVLRGNYSNNTKYESIVKNEEFDLFLMDRVKKYMKGYVNNRRELSNPLVNILKHKNYSSFPDVLVVTGNLDPLRDEGREFADKLIKYNPNSRYYNLNLAMHGFLKNDDKEIKRELYSVILDFLK